MRTPARSAGCSIARLYSSAVIGPTSTWFAGRAAPRAPDRRRNARRSRHATRERRSRSSADRGAGLDDCAQEGVALVLVGAEREDLFELVDHEDEPFVRAGCPSRVAAQRPVPRPRAPCELARAASTRVRGRARVAGARRDASARDDPLVALRKHAHLQRRHETGADGGRLAAARKGRRRRAAAAPGEPRNQLGDEALATVEPLRVVDVEAGKSLVGRLCGLRRAACPARCRTATPARARAVGRRRCAARSPSTARRSLLPVAACEANTPRAVGCSACAQSLTCSCTRRGTAAARLEQPARERVDGGADVQRGDPADLVEPERLRPEHAVLAADPPHSREQLR